MEFKDEQNRSHEKIQLPCMSFFIISVIMASSTCPKMAPSVSARFLLQTTSRSKSVCVPFFSSRVLSRNCIITFTYISLGRNKSNDCILVTAEFENCNYYYKWPDDSLFFYKGVGVEDIKEQKVEKQGRKRLVL